MNILLLLACASSNGGDTASNDAVLAKGETPEGLGERGPCWPHPRLYAVYYDGDGDGYGDDSTAQASRWTPIGYVTEGGDCDDADATVYAGCDTGGTDTGEPPIHDNDGDTYVDGIDCDDADATVYPGAAETGNRVDDNCDGRTDEGLGLVVSYGGGSGTIWTWYGSGGSASADVTSGSEYLVFSPSTADYSDHPWVDLQFAPADGSDWSDGCASFAATSSDWATALYQRTDATGTCRVYLNGSTPSGSDSTTYTAYP